MPDSGFRKAPITRHRFAFPTGVDLFGVPGRALTCRSPKTSGGVVSLPITVYVKDSTLVSSRARIWPQQHVPKRLKTYATRNGRRLKTRLFGHLQRSRRAQTDEQKADPLGVDPLGVRPI